MIRRLLTALVLLALPTAPLFAQEGPYVPCGGCDEFTQVTYPETGHWYNPDQSGTGFNLEFQNGIMAGYYYGYDSEGNPEWYLVTNPLVRSETPGVMWELEVEPQRYTGGNCMGCPYQAPNDPEALPAIKIEFFQRAYARLTLNDGSIQYMVPIMYGSEGKAFFAEQTPYTLPVFPSAERFVWSLLFKDNGQENEPWNWRSDIYVIGKALTGFPNEGNYSYLVDAFTNPPEVLVNFGIITCGTDEEGGEPSCVFKANNYIDPLNPYNYRISLGNFTDSHFFGETEGGDTVKGYRLEYD